MKTDEGVARLEAVREALRAFEVGPLRDRAEALLGVLGYGSERCDEDFDYRPEDFLEWADGEADGRRIPERPRQMIRETWNRINMVFQYTDAELGRQVDLFGGEADPRRWEKSRVKSFLFLAVDLREGDHPRHRLAAMTRAVNRPLKMPGIIIFRYRRGDGSTALTVAVIHRRAHKRDPDRDVLERATLIKDIRVADPHRAHVDILAELALPSLSLEHRTFDALHAAWESVLDTEALNKQFYKELFGWFERAVAEAKFPDAAPAEEQVIRLITRMLFVWFVKEKGLVAEDWFDESAMQHLLRDFGGSDYYRAVLQNLFFATLNTPMDQRRFSARTRTTHRVFSRYRYQSLIRDVERFKLLMQRTPFINGGLFDCLDDEQSRSAGGRRIDMFSDPDPRDGQAAAQARRKAWEQLNVPDELFFGAEGLLGLLASYKFTVEENTPVNVEVALDPELLGRVFENLLAAHNPETRERVRGDRKRTGSFYTPRKIVDYLVDQTLIPAIEAKAKPSDGDPVFWRERLRYLLDYEDAGELFERADAHEITRAISTLKVLDPAVGSGAFAMAVLQKLTLALRRLDRDNTVWQQLQKERAMGQADSAFDEQQKVARNEELLQISEAFARYSGDFGRKLYLIQNSIYGVDIQSIACQIARLRFFISLAIEQERDDSAENMGIRPLPNLDTRFVAASTLLGLTETQRTFPGDKVHDIEEQLAANRERHFHARTRPEKLHCIRTDRTLRTKLGTALEDAGFSEAVATRIAEWDPYDQTSSADWFDPEHMFGVRDGFDIVLGNPPYVRADFPDDRHRELRETIVTSGQYQTLWEKWDLFLPFIEKGFQLLKPNGTISYIVSDAYCHAKYAEKSQHWFLRNARIVRMDFLGSLRIFDAAVRNVIFVYQRADGRTSQPERRLHDERFGNVTRLPTDKQRNLTARQVFFPEGMADSPSDEYGKSTIRLDQICYISVGMVAHAHEKHASGEFRLTDLVSRVRNKAHPKPFVEGKHLARWLPATYRWIEWDTDRAPSLFRRPTFPQMYEVQEKLISVDMAAGATQLRVAYDCGQLLHNHSAWSFVRWADLRHVRNRSIKRKTRYADEKPKRPDLPRREALEETSSHFDMKYLLGVMNSTSARDFLLANRRSNIHLYPADWANLPIPDCGEEDQERVVRIVNAILTAKRADIDADVTTEEEELDRVVRELYGMDSSP